MNNNFRVLAASLLATLAWAPAAAGPAADAAPLSVVASFDVVGLDSASLLAAAQVADAEGAPFQFAEPVAADLDAKDAGTWEALADGRLLWRHVVTSEGALSLNLGFTEFFLPPGAEMYLSPVDGKGALGPFTEADNEAHGQFWTPIVPGDGIVVEVQLPPEEQPNLRLKIGSVNHGFRGLRALAEKSGSCNVDTVCSQGDLWRDEIRSVAAYSTGGSIFCTGALVNNTARDRRGFFLTADHCDVDSTSAAASMVVYWNFENSTCRTPGSGASGGNGDGPLTQFNTGAIYRAKYAASDMTLVELDDPISEAFNVHFAGWDRRNYTPTSAVAIHHPNGDEKRISFENEALAITTYLQNAVPGNSSHLRVVDWDLGTTEPGSSGSPLFDATTKCIVGQLHGGYAACGNNDSDWYGRLFISWTGGGTDATRLSNWLDPANTNEEFIDGLDQGGLSLVVPVAVDDSAGGDGDGVLEPGEENVLVLFVLKNNETAPVQNILATLGATTPGIVVTDAAGAFPDIAAGANAPLSNAVAITVPPSHPCGVPVALTLAVDSSTVDAQLAASLPTGPSCDVAPVFSFVSTDVDDSTGNGNGNGKLDPGETSVELVVTLQNDGGASDSMPAVLSSETPTVTVISASSPWPATPKDAESSNADPFVLWIDPSHPCGAAIDLSLLLSSGDFATTIPLTLATGPDPLVSARSVAQSVAIPDAGGASASAPIAFPETGTVVDVNVTLGITHTYDADLDISLLGPNGTSRLLVSGRGGSGDNFTSTVLDDEALVSIAAGSPPFTGSFRPEQSLDVFDGIPITGTWQIVATDTEAQDTGTINVASGVTISYATSCPGPLTLSVDMTNLATASPLPDGGTVDFGTAELGSSPVARAIEIENTGAGTLMLSEGLAPAGFAFASPLPSSIGPGASATFTVEMSTAVAGTTAGTLTFATNNPANPQIAIELTGQVFDGDSSSWWAIR